MFGALSCVFVLALKKQKHFETLALLIFKMPH
jgi:hypothetical protein